MLFALQLPGDRSQYLLFMFINRIQDYTNKLIHTYLELYRNGDNTWDKRIKIKGVINKYICMYKYILRIMYLSINPPVLRCFGSALL